MKITISTLESFRKSVGFLTRHKSLLEAGLENSIDLRDFHLALTHIEIMARKLGEAELTVRG
jgi:hypothetical protein